MKKVKYILLLFMVVFMIGCTQDNNTDYDKEKVTNTEQKQITDDLNSGIGPDLIDEKKIITKFELALHNSPDDCWVAYDSNVYDITAYLPQHPDEGSSIEKLCGTSSQFEQGFTSKHGTGKVSKLESQMFKGKLVQ